MCLNRVGNVVGHVDGLFGEGVRGWACAPDLPEERLWLELLVDDCPVGIGRAENHHPDATAYGDGCYGFWLTLPPMLRDAPGTARVRVANTNAFVEPPVALASAKESGLLGAVGSDMGLTVSGWVRDPAEPDRVLRVSAWLNGKIVTEAPAHERRFRPETSDGHGFNLSLPLELADGETRLIAVLDDEKRPIPGSPVLVCALPHGMKNWLASQKKLDVPQRKLVSAVLSNYEQWLPKGVSLDEFSAWQACFPVADAAMNKGLRVGIVDGRSVTPENLRVVATEHDAVLWHNGEQLHPHAVAHMARAMRESNAALVYADATHHDGEHTIPHCKSAWDVYRFMCHDNLGPYLMRSALVNVPSSCAESTLATLRTRQVLTAHETVDFTGIIHLPIFLSETDGETAAIPTCGREIVIREWLQERGHSIDVEAVDTEISRVRWKLPRTPLVSILIPTRDRVDLLRACLTSLDKTTYPAVEIVLLDNGSTDAEAKALLRLAEKGRVCRHPVRVIECPGPFNYAAINNRGAREATGELLCLLNNDTEVMHADWLDELVGVALNPLDANVGVVGAKLLWPNRLTQHAGVVVGTHQLAAHIGNQWPDNDAGYMQLNCVTRQVSAVTAACLLTPRKLFLEHGGFDVARFPVAFNDVDYCLRLREAGKRIVWTPHAKLLHHESASRGHDESPAQKARSSMEMQHFRSLWGAYTDPFYNPNLSLSTVLEPFAGLALPPRSRSFR